MATVAGGKPKPLVAADMLEFVRSLNASLEVNADNRTLLVSIALVLNALTKTTVNEAIVPRAVPFQTFADILVTACLKHNGFFRDIAELERGRKPKSEFESESDFDFDFDCGAAGETETETKTESDWIFVADRVFKLIIPVRDCEPQSFSFRTNTDTDTWWVSMTTSFTTLACNDCDWVEFAAKRVICAVACVVALYQDKMSLPRKVVVEEHICDETRLTRTVSTGVRLLPLKATSFLSFDKHGIQGIDFQEDLMAELGGFDSLVTIHSPDGRKKEIPGASWEIPGDVASILKKIDVAVNTCMQARFPGEMLSCIEGHVIPTYHFFPFLA